MQQFLQGRGSLNTIEKVLPPGMNSIFLVAGNHFYKDYSLDFLKGYNVQTFRKSGPNVADTEIDKAFTEYQQGTAKVILAIGGGSVIDLAKSVIYRCVQAKLPIPYFIAAPTTTGSGSEATQFAVVYLDKKKVSWVHPELLPKAVILDAELTYSLSAAQTVIPGMDVLAQAIESWWSLQSNDESKRYAEESIGIWKQWFPHADSFGGPVIRENMQYAAYLAGKAINITRTTGPHALSYYLTAQHNVPHGQAVSFFLPLFFLYNQPQSQLCALLGVKDENEAKEFIQTKMRHAGMATRLSDLGINKNAIVNDLLDSVNEERFSNNPKPFDRQKLEALILEHL